VPGRHFRIASPLHPGPTFNLRLVQPVGCGPSQEGSPGVLPLFHQAASATRQRSSYSYTSQSAPQVIFLI
jgi:hypothetical protein